MKCYTKSPKIIKRIISEILRFIIFSGPNEGKYGLKKLRIRILFMQLCHNSLYFRFGLFILTLKDIWYEDDASGILTWAEKIVVEILEPV